METLSAPTFMLLPIDEVQLDTTNPRIRRFLESYQGTDPTPEQIFLALGAGGDDDDASGPSFEKLKNSIQTNGGIIQPIIVNRRSDGSYICIEGNTRLALYKNFLTEGVNGNWSQIPALVSSNMDASQVDAIRLQIHLVGTRQWDPYSKAKYLTQLRNEKLMPFSAVVDYCGGRQREVIELIQAYTDMENHYRPILPDDGAFDATRFSGFVELQKHGIKEAIINTGHTLDDFAKWIHEQKLSPLNTVRMLPSLLKHPEAKAVFLKDGAKAAIPMLGKPDMSKALKEATIAQLAQALSQAVYGLSWKEAQRIQSNQSAETAQALNEALSALSDFMNSSLNGD
jgi:hypothetical protein